MVIKTVWRSMVIKKHEQIEALWHPQSFRCNGAPDGIVAEELIHLHNIIIFINDIIYFMRWRWRCIDKNLLTHYTKDTTLVVYRVPMYRVEFICCVKSTHDFYYIDTYNTYTIRERTRFASTRHHARRTVTSAVLY